MKNITAKQFYDFTCKMIEIQLKKSDCKNEYDFEFSFHKKDLPFDFSEDQFLKFLKDYFNLGVIHLEDVMGYKYRCWGEKGSKYSCYGEIKMTPEEVCLLKSFGN